jgi:hypothetical protein
MKPKVEELMIDRMDQNQEIVNRYLNDQAFQAVAFQTLVKPVHSERAAASGHHGPSSHSQNSHKVESLGQHSPATSKVHVCTQRMG